MVKRLISLIHVPKTKLKSMQFDGENQYKTFVPIIL